MITTELFRADPYRRTCAGRISSLSSSGVVLDQTCFAPPGVSGYPGDLGWIGSHRIVSVAKNSRKRLVHHFDGQGPGGHQDTSLALGDRVECELDWPRRYLSMRLHTAQHLVELAFRSTHDLTAVSSAPVGDYMLAMKPVLASGSVDLGAINGWVETAIRDDLPMTVSVEPAPPYRWLWHLDGYGHRYCDGLHVRSTGEINAIDVSHGDRATDEVLVSLERSSPDV